jgi:hypothetical protein
MTVPVCTYCRKPGHTEEVCYSKRDGRPPTPAFAAGPAGQGQRGGGGGGRGGRGGRTGGRGRGTSKEDSECFRCHQKGHWAAECPTPLEAVGGPGGASRPTPASGPGSGGSGGGQAGAAGQRPAPYQPAVCTTVVELLPEVYAWAASTPAYLASDSDEEEGNGVREARPPTPQRTGNAPAQLGLRSGCVAAGATVQTKGEVEAVGQLRLRLTPIVEELVDCLCGA